MQIRRDILVPATSVISCEDCKPSQKIALDKNGSYNFVCVCVRVCVTEYDHPLGYWILYTNSFNVQIYKSIACLPTNWVTHTTT